MTELFPTVRTLVLMGAFLLSLTGLAQTDTVATTTCHQADGRTYRGRVTHNGIMEGNTELSFRDGSCHLRVGRGWGFSPGQYACEQESGGMRVTSRLESRSQGHLNVDVLLLDGTVDGHFDWEKPGQHALRFDLSGRIQVDPTVP